MNHSHRHCNLIFGFSISLASVVSAAEPNFVMPSQAQYRAKYANASSIYKNDYEAEQIDYTTFIDMLVDGWLREHHPEGGNRAERWEMPAANDWVGCVLYEFPKPEVFKRIDFRSYTRSKDLTEWVLQHEQSVAKTEGGPDLVGRLKALPEWSKLCEDLVRGDDGVRL
jgi:hypothetical protein